MINKILCKLYGHKENTSHIYPDYSIRICSRCGSKRRESAACVSKKVRKIEQRINMEIKWLEKRSWNEFRQAGLLWFTNRILHLFGWTICIDYEDLEAGIIKEAYPARCRFRGFDNKNEDDGFKDLTKHLKENIDELEADTML